MSIAELVRRARSIRRFDRSRPIPPEVVRGLVDLARLTPCGGNKQPLRYRLVTDPAECAAVFPFTAWAGALPDWGGPRENERPTAYIAICSPAGGTGPGADLGIAGQTMQLAACEQGYGACMLGALKNDDIHRVLRLPPEYTVRLLLALGAPGEKVVLEDLPPGGDTRYYRTADGVHHVPKHRLETVLLAPAGAGEGGGGSHGR